MSPATSRRSTHECIANASASALPERRAVSGVLGTCERGAQARVGGCVRCATKGVW